MNDHLFAGALPSNVQFAKVEVGGMKTILVVEDNAGIRDMVREYLSEHGYRVRVASNGKEGLLEARHAKPDLILLDVMMPQVDGLECLRAYRAGERVP